VRLHTIVLSLVCALLAIPNLALARPDGNYPKLLTYSNAINNLPEAVKDTIAKYDVLVCRDRISTINYQLRRRNPAQKYLWEYMVQFALYPEGDNPWWLPDTLWSIARLQQWYADKNNWYLRDTDGQILDGGGQYYLNWTRYCPVGTYGTAKGLRASQWIASVCMPTLTLLPGPFKPPQPPWSWTSRSTYNGIMFEILADCFGSYGDANLKRADPNQDGIAEGVDSVCTRGGSNEPLSVLYREENEEFYDSLSVKFPTDFVFLGNENVDQIGPWWRTKLSGMKFENWLRPHHSEWMDWWDWFYGVTPFWLPHQNWGAGYYWAEQVFDKEAPDSLRGWDLSFICVWKDNHLSDAENARQMRYGLGTTLLGDGYFAYLKDERYPTWPAEFDWNLGRPTSDFAREVYGADTVYVRLFTRSMVEVNPQQQVVNGVPPQDTQFTFWHPVSDLRCSLVGDSLCKIRADWTAPRGERGDSLSYELRYATFPLTIANWDSANSYVGNPIVVPDSQAVSDTLTGLYSNRYYHVAIRTRHHGRTGRLEPFLSDTAGVRTCGLCVTVPIDGSPEDARLIQFSPNPFHRVVHVTYQVSRSGPVRLSIHDLQGREIAVLVNQSQEAGRHVVSWDGRASDGSPISVGNYFARLECGGRIRSSKVMALR